MYDNFNEIAKNAYINCLDGICKDFGLYGAYIDNVNEDINSDYSAIYFVMGMDKNKVYNPDINISSLIKKQQREKDFVPIDVCAIKITNEAPLVVNQNVIEYCKNIELIKNIYEVRAHVLPTKIHKISLEYISSLYERSITSTDYSHVAVYRDAIGEFMTSNNALTNPLNPQYQYCSSLFKNTDNIKDEITFDKDSNLLSAVRLLNASNNIIRTKIRKELLKDLKSEMKKHPSILYWHGSMQNTPEPITTHSLKNVKEYYDSFYVNVAFDANYQDDMNRIFAKIKHPEVFKYNISDISKNKSHLCYISIRDKDLPVIYACIDNANIKVAIDNNNFNYTNHQNEVTIVVHSRDSQRVNEILKKFVVVTRNQHLFRKETQMKSTAITEELNVEKLQKNIAWRQDLETTLNNAGIDYKSNKKQIDNAIDMLMQMKSNKDEER